MKAFARLLLAAGIAAIAIAAPATAQDAGTKRWKQGTGWGWVWGPEDEVGALNEMTDASRAAALRLATRGQAYDLGLPYDRNSYRWPGHNPGEIMSFRSPAGVQQQRDLPFTTPEGGNTGHTRWHSNAMFISDNVATQIDGLAHITHGADNHWYNGFKEEQWGGDFGVRKMDVTKIPPIVARGVMIDVAGQKGMEALPSNYEITVADLEAALRAQNVDVTPGTVVLIRTGTARHWGENGADHGVAPQR